MSEQRGAFERLVARHRGEILAYLVRVLGNESDAQDACQDALLRAYRACGRLAPNSNGRACLYKIATRSALNAAKRQKQRAGRSVDVDPDTLASSSAALDQRAQLHRVRHAVDALPPKQRAALMQRQFEGLSYDEIAACLGCTAAAARANVYQAIKKLRAMLVP